jgi:hypothetical protein
LVEIFFEAHNHIKQIYSKYPDVESAQGAEGSGESSGA